MQTPFAIDISANADRRLVALSGELDIAHAPDLEAAIAKLCDEGAHEIVVDLSDVVFIDSSGLRALLAGMSTCSERGCSYLLDPDLPMAVRRLFEVAGVGSRFSFSAQTQSSSSA